MAGGAVFQLDQAAFAHQGLYGTSENAVKTQIWISISVYVLVAILKKHLASDRSLYSILQILSVNVFEQAPLPQVLRDYAPQNPEGDIHNQLVFNDL